MYFKIFGTKPPKIEDDNQKQEPQAITKEDNTTLFENLEDDYKYKQQYKFIGIVFNTYIIFEMDDEMYISWISMLHMKELCLRKVKKNFYSDDRKRFTINDFTRHNNFNT